MGDYFDWWIGGGTWYDRKQQEQISSLSATHARSTSRLRSQLREEAKRSQDLATRLSKLEDAVVASIELEDLRGEMDNFSDAVATRRYARDVLARIPALARVASAENPSVPPDVPDYWLHPAVRAVDAALRGDAATEREAADEARRRDPARTAQFLAAVAILRGSDVADDDLATLWPTSQQVSRYQRSLWVAVANGGLGEDARSSLVSALRWALQQHPESEPDENDTTRFVRVAQPRAAAATGDPSLETVVLSGLLSRRWPVTPEGAAETLVTLRERVEVALESGGEVARTGEVPDGVADLLAQVVSAGAPAEEPLVSRIVQLRGALAEIGAATSIAAPAMLDDTALDVVELLADDLDDQADPGVRAVAVRVLAEPIENVASKLADDASVQLNDAAEVRTSVGVKIPLSSAGADDNGWRARVAERVRSRAPSTRPLLGWIIGGGVGLLLGVVLGIVASPGWYALAVAGAGAAAYGYWQLRRSEAEIEQRATKVIGEADAAINARAAELAGALVVARTRQTAAPDELAGIRAALTR